jgi:hypothetical protein
LFINFKWFAYGELKLLSGNHMLDIQTYGGIKIPYQITWISWDSVGFSTFSFGFCLSSTSAQQLKFSISKSFEIYKQGQGSLKESQVWFRTFPLFPFWSYSPWFAEKYIFTLAMDTFLHLLFLVLLMDVHSESVSYETTQLIQCKIWYIFLKISQIFSI